MREIFAVRHYGNMWIVLTMLLVSVVPAAAQSRPPSNPATVRNRAAQPATKNDAQLERDIRTRFQQSKIGRNNFQVHVQGGAATIEGQTDVLQHKGTATRLARSVGAARVVNKIQVSQAARERAAAGLAQGRRRAQIKRGEARSAHR
jgi:hypothetical protein